jgi:hypothetical protein
MPHYNVRISPATNRFSRYPVSFITRLYDMASHLFRKLYRSGVLHKRGSCAQLGRTKAFGIFCGQLVSAYGLLAYARRMQLQHGCCV